MVAMRRISISLLAAGYALSFVAVCLGACLVAPAAAEHACCDGEAGLHAAARDCCVVTQGVSPTVAHVAPTIPVLLTLPDDIAVSLTSVIPNAGPVPLAASPPLVLRI